MSLGFSSDPISYFQESFNPGFPSDATVSLPLDITLAACMPPAETLADAWSTQTIPV